MERPISYLRGNFLYGREFAGQMSKIVTDKLRGAREITLADVDARSYAAKLRDAFFRLFSPFL